MKQILLLLIHLFVFGSIASAQIVFSIGDCSENQGFYDFFTPIVSEGWDLQPNMNDPENSITGSLVFADDSLACTEPVNASELAGNVAVVYRGTCEFGAKALAMQDAGAIGCLVINNEPDALPLMSGGVEGFQVTIPIWGITGSDGALLASEIAAGTIDCAFYGSLVGLFEENLSINNFQVLRPANTGNLAELCQDETEFSVEFGAWVHNLGQNNESEMVLNVTIEYDGTVIYNESSDPTEIDSGDSLYIALPTFAQSTYPVGIYSTNYSVSGAGEDGYLEDNVVNSDFQMGTVYSYGRLDESGLPVIDDYSPGYTELGESNTCLYFSDPNASRVELNSLSFSAVPFGELESIEDYEIELRVYEWLDTDLSDYNDISIVEDREYVFSEEDAGQILTLDFDEPIELDDEQDYLFCITHFYADLGLAYDDNTQYDLNEPQFLNTPYFNDDLGFGQIYFDAITAMTANFSDPLSVNDDKANIEITPFPNPVSDILTIPFTEEMTRRASLSIYSTDGRLVDKQVLNINPGQLEVNVSAISNGAYVFEVLSEEGSSRFKVVVNR